MTRIERLARLVLDEIGLPGWSVEMARLSDLGLRAATDLAQRRILFDRDFDDSHPGLVVAATLHEAAHAFAGVPEHGPAFWYQWDWLISEEILRRILDAGIAIILADWYLVPDLALDPEVRSSS